MSAATTIRAFFDHIARGLEDQAIIWPTDSDLWKLVDAAGDETLENAIKGTQLSLLDADLQRGGRWAGTEKVAVIQCWEAYFAALGYTTVVKLQGYLAAMGLRLSQRAAVAYGEGAGGTLAALYVGPQGVLPADGADPSDAGLWRFGTLDADATTWTAGDGETLPSTVGPAAAVAINLGSSQTAGGTFRCYGYTAPTAYKDIALSLSGATQYTQTVLGEKAIASAAAAGQAVVPVGTTAPFTAGEYVLVRTDDDTQELAQIDSIQANTSLTMRANLVNSYATGVVRPQFGKVAYQSGASGAGDVAVYARPDRTLAYWTP